MKNYFTLISLKIDLKWSRISHLKRLIIHSHENSLKKYNHNSKIKSFFKAIQEIIIGKDHYRLNLLSKPGLICIDKIYPFQLYNLVNLYINLVYSE